MSKIEQKSVHNQKLVPFCVGDKKGFRQVPLRFAPGLSGRSGKADLLVHQDRGETLDLHFDLLSRYSPVSGRFGALGKIEGALWNAGGPLLGWLLDYVCTQILPVGGVAGVQT